MGGPAKTEKPGWAQESSAVDGGLGKLRPEAEGLGHRVLAALRFAEVLALPTVRKTEAHPRRERSQRYEIAPVDG
jgi:hypothetical protein